MNVIMVPVTASVSFAVVMALMMPTIAVNAASKKRIEMDVHELSMLVQPNWIIFMITRAKWAA